MDKLKFSQNELLEMESLEVRGGACNINSDKKINYEKGFSNN